MCSRPLEERGPAVITVPPLPPLCGDEIQAATPYATRVVSITSYMG